MMVALRRSSIQRQTVTDQVHRRLKQAIIDGELEPGERLVEIDIAARLGASRTPVREALSKLEQEGLVTPVRFGGLAVARLSEVDVVEIFSLIKLLESNAGRLAAERATDKQLEKLDMLCKRAALLGDDETERLGELNQQFHEQVVEAAGHKRMQDLIMSLRAALRPYRLVSLESAEFRKRSVLDHRAILEALRSRKGDSVERMMFEHLDFAQQAAVAHIRESSKAARPGSDR